MGKSILVIDTPKSCIECELHAITDYNEVPSCEMYCVVMGEIVEDFCTTKRADWCPLKEIPKNKNETQYLTRKDNRGNTETYGEKVSEYAVGYNACIKEILKERE